MIALILSLLAARAAAQGINASELRRQLDEGVPKILRRTGTPSASIAIVLGGRVVLVKAYGSANHDPSTPARPDLRYGIGSISKQFTAAAMLLLAEEGRVSLDDRVAKFFPDLPGGGEVSIRQLLSHTADLLLQDGEYLRVGELRVRTVLLGLQQGKIERSQFTPDANAYFDQQVLGDYAASLRGLGEIMDISAGQPSRRAGQRFVNYTVRFKSAVVLVNTAETADGKYAQFLVQAIE